MTKQIFQARSLMRLQRSILTLILAIGVISLAADWAQANPQPPTAATPPPAATPPATQPATSQPAATTQRAAATQPVKPVHLSSADQVLEFLKANEPDVYQSAALLKEKDPKKYEALMHQMSADVHHLLDIDKHNHDMFVKMVTDRDLGYKALQLAKDLRDEGLPAEVRKAKSDELKGIVSEQFDTRRTLRTMEIDELEARISQLEDKIKAEKQQMDDRDQHKDDLVNQRLMELLSANPKVDW